MVLKEELLRDSNVDEGDNGEKGDDGMIASVALNCFIALSRIHRGAYLDTQRWML